MSSLKRWICGILVLLPLATAALAEPLRVGIRNTPPFAFPTAEQAWAGISVESWERIAARLDLEYIYVPQPQLEPMFQALASGELDVAVGAITVTARREERVDFSHPFFSAGVGIATRRDDASLLDAAGSLLSPRFITTVATLILLLLGVGVLMWLVERGKNPQFPKNPVEGVGDGFWWSAVTMTTVGYGDKAPVTLAGRTLGVIWMFVGIIAISSFTAAITSSLTLQELDGRIRSLDDLRRAAVVTVAGSTAAELLDERGQPYRAEADAAAALGRLVAGEADAVVYDAPVLSYLIKRQGLQQLRMLPQNQAEQSYAIALQPGSARREAINRQLLELRAGPEWPRLLNEYLGH